MGLFYNANKAELTTFGLMFIILMIILLWFLIVHKFVPYTYNIGAPKIFKRMLRKANKNNKSEYEYLNNEANLLSIIYYSATYLFAFAYTSSFSGIVDMSNKDTIRIFPCNYDRKPDLDDNFILDLTHIDLSKCKYKNNKIKIKINRNAPLKKGYYVIRKNKFSNDSVFNDFVNMLNHEK